jgi:uncharacterized membrane protein
MTSVTFFNILFMVAVVVLVVVLWLIMSGRKKKQQRDETHTVAGRFQTGLAHRFNTPEIRK